MKPRKTMIRSCLCVLAGVGFVAAEFEISRSTIDGGGIMRSTGGSFELSGTIGQPDTSVMTGADFQLSGGFWFATPPGDCNEDGGVNLIDAERFTVCMSGPTGAPPVDDCRCFDVNRDDTVDLLDFAAGQRSFTGP